MENNRQKKCSRCHKEMLMSLDFFSKNKTSRDGLSGWCKGCHKEYKNKHKEKISDNGRRYYQENKDKIKIQSLEWSRNNKDKKADMGRKYRTANKDKKRELDRQYQIDNREKIQKGRKKYRDKNQEIIRERKAQYYQENKDKINEHFKNKRRNNVGFRIKCNLRSRVWDALKNQRALKYSGLMKILGCSIDDFRKHLESQFRDGMSWDNYGKKGWHIDHIKPCACFDLTDYLQQKKCFNYTNLQPLWAEDNYAKNSFHNGERQ